MGFWAALASKLSCLCGFNRKEDDGGTTEITINSRQSCCNRIKIVVPTDMDQVELVRMIYASLTVLGDRRSS